MDELMEKTTLLNSGNIGAFATSGGTAIQTILQQYTGFAPAMLHIPIEKILEQFRLGNKSVAKGQLSILREMGNQDPMVLPALDIVSIYLNLLEKSETSKARTHLTEYLANNPKGQSSTLLFDLCCAALLRLEFQEFGKEAAQALLKTLDLSGPHTKETVYTLLLSADELDGIMSRGALLTAIELRGVIEGAILQNAYEIADKAVSRLCVMENGYTTNVLRLVVEAGLIQAQIENRMYWSVTATIHDKLMRLADEIAELLLLEPLPDDRLPLFAATLLYYIQGESEKLSKACWNKISLIDQSHNKCAVLLRFQFDNDTSGFTESAQNFHRAENDKAFRQTYLEQLLSSPMISSDGCAFLVRYAAPNVLQKWLDDGGSICNDTDEFSREILLIYLKCCAKKISNKRHRHENRELKSVCQDFLANHACELEWLHPEFVLKLSTCLMWINLPNEACNFIRPLLSSGDYWLSPILRCYLDALLMAEQYSTIYEVLNNISDHHWDGMIWQIKARLEFFIGQYGNALESLEAGFAIAPNAQIAVGLFEALSKTGKEADFSRVLDVVPDSILSLGDPYSNRIIMEMFKLGFHDRAERIVLDWFVSDPESSAIPISNILTGLIVRPDQIDFGMSSSNKAMLGVQYHDGKTSLTKLVVPPELAKGQHLVSSDSPLGKRLLEAAPKENFKEGIVRYTLEERLPAIVAAYRIALYIRDNMNQGEDAFHMLNVSDDVELLIDQLKDIMAPEKVGKSELLKHELLPIMCKGKMLRRENPFETALGLMSDVEAVKHPLPEFDNHEFPDEMLLDVYTVAFIAIAGLVPGLLALNKCLFVSIETETFIKQWLVERQRVDGGSLTTLPDGRPLFFTAEDMRRRTDHIADLLQQLLERVKVIYPLLVDINSDLLEFNELLDSSVYSTLRLSTTRNIPWLCIDTKMAQMINSLGWPVVKNCLFILTEASKLTQFTDRKFGLFRHAYEDLPFPLRFEDLIDLSRDEDVSSIELLSKLLKKYPNAFNNAENAAISLTDLFMPALANSYAKEALIILKSVDDHRFPSHIRKLANTCFYVATQSGGDQKAEYKFSLLLHSMIMRLVTALGYDLSRQFVNTVTGLATNFCRGHSMSFEAVNQYLHDQFKGANKKEL